MRGRLVLLALLAGPAMAEPNVVVTLLGVPELRGAFTLDVELDGRFEDVFEGPRAVEVPTNFALVRLGYQRYLEQHGRLGVGGYLEAGGNVPAWTAPGQPDFLRLGLGVRAHLRGMNARFLYLAVAPFAEISLLARTSDPASDLQLDRARLDPARPDPALPARGMRWAVGLSAGFGGLSYLGPFVFTSSLTRLGIEVIEFNGVRQTALMMAMTFGFDFAHR